jgi:hypothetical protein
MISICVIHSNGQVLKLFYLVMSALLLCSHNSAMSTSAQTGLNSSSIEATLPLSCEAVASSTF